MTVPRGSALLDGVRVRIAEFEPKAQTLVLHVADVGPAGSATLEFGRVSVSFDVAHPALVNSIVFRDVSGPAALTDDEVMIDRLMPADVIDSILELVSRGRPRRIPIDAARPKAGAGESPVALIWWSLSMSAASQSRPELLEAERILQAAQTALIAEDLQIRPRGMTDQAVFESLNALLGLSLGELDLLDELTAGGVARVVSAASVSESVARLEARLSVVRRMLDGANAADWMAAGDDLGRRDEDVPVGRDVAAGPLGALRDLARRWSGAPSPSYLRHAGVPAVVVEASQEAFGGPLPIESCDSLNLVTGGPELLVAPAFADAVEGRLIAFGERSERWWVRCFRGDEASPVAVAQIRCAPNGDGVCQLPIGQSVLGDLQWDVVAEPSLARPTTLESATRRAIASGVTAARLSRVGAIRKARLFWMDAALHFAVAGEQQLESSSVNLAEGVLDSRGSAARSVVRAPILATDLAGGVPAAPPPTVHMPHGDYRPLGKPGAPPPNGGPSAGN